MTPDARIALTFLADLAGGLPRAPLPVPGSEECYSGVDVPTRVVEAAVEGLADNKPLQSRVADWMAACFGPEISSDRIERNHRFLEEALELVQACGCTKSEARQLVDYVYDRPQGDINQEVGGVMITLAALCLANSFDVHAAGEIELVRIWEKIDKIRAKQAAKPRHSPLPESVDKPPPALRLNVPERAQDEAGWLIERYDSIKYWGRDTVGFNHDLSDPCFWTPDHLDAVRFARREDAQLFIKERKWGHVARPVEHMWITPSAGESVGGIAGPSAEPSASLSPSATAPRLPTDEWSDLEAKAHAATQGEWLQERRDERLSPAGVEPPLVPRVNAWRDGRVFGGFICQTNTGREMVAGKTLDNAAFIAAAGPEAVLRLIAAARHVPLP